MRAIVMVRADIRLDRETEEALQTCAAVGVYERTVEARLAGELARLLEANSDDRLDVKVIIRSDDSEAQGADT